MGDVDKEAKEEVKAVYADLAVLGEVRDCVGRTTCCRFLLTGRTPMLTAGEALVAAEGVRASGRKTLPDAEDMDGRCPLLGGDGRCTVYAHRPFGCRTHFCGAAGGPYARAAVSGLIQRLEAVGEMLGDTDVRAIGDAVRDALEGCGRRRGKGRKR